MRGYRKVIIVGGALVFSFVMAMVLSLAKTENAAVVAGMWGTIVSVCVGAFTYANLSVHESQTKGSTE